MYIETWEVESPDGDMLQIAYTEAERQQGVVRELRTAMEDLHRCRLVKLLRVENTDDWTADTPQTDTHDLRTETHACVDQTDCPWK